MAEPPLIIEAGPTTPADKVRRWIRGRRIMLSGILALVEVLAFIIWRPSAVLLAALAVALLVVSLWAATRLRPGLARDLLWIVAIAQGIVVVIPLVTHGMTRISRFQIITQPLWIILNILPVGFIAMQDWSSFPAWLAFPGSHGGEPGFDLLKFGAAASVILALMPQIGEQVDVLRFLPPEGAKPTP